MFDIGSSELLLIVVVAVVAIGPKDLPRVLYKVGQVVGKARAMARHFRSGLDAMIREAELEELQKQWDRENARIMAQNPMSDIAASMKPLADEATGASALPAPDETSADPAPEAPPAAAPDSEPHPRKDGAER